jgi:hypothetical protein
VYRGAYQDANGVLMFLFDSSSGHGVHEPWDDATGILEVDSLTIQYQESMQHALATHLFFTSRRWYRQGATKAALGPTG